MRRTELVHQIADLKKRQAIKNAYLQYIESTTNWQSELYNSNRDALFEITEELDKKMDEYYFVCKTEILMIDTELSKIQDALMADPFDYDNLVAQEKDAKGKRLEIWHEMKEVLWVDNPLHCTPSALKGTSPRGGKAAKPSFQIVDDMDSVRRECEATCQNPECLQTACMEHEKRLTEQVREEAHNG